MKAGKQTPSNKFHPYTQAVLSLPPVRQTWPAAPDAPTAPARTSQPAQALVVVNQDLDYLFSKMRPSDRDEVLQNSGTCYFTVYGKLFLKRLATAVLGAFAMKGANEISRQDGRVISDSSRLNFVYSAIGAAHRMVGEDLALEMAVQILGKWTEFYSWSDFEQEMEGIDEPKGNPQDLSYYMRTLKILGHNFRDPGLLIEAFSCSTVARKDAGLLTYDRLEFIGDMVLAGLLFEYWQGRYPDESSSTLTKLTVDSATNNCLGAICINLGLYDFLLEVDNDLQSEIQSSVSSLLGALASGNSQGQYWENCRIDKSLGDLIGSVFGAIYVDSGFNWLMVRSVFGWLVAPTLNSNVSLSNMWVHPVKKLKSHRQFGCSQQPKCRKDTAKNPLSLSSAKPISPFQRRCTINLFEDFPFKAHKPIQVTWYYYLLTSAVAVIGLSTTSECFLDYTDAAPSALLIRDTKTFRAKNRRDTTESYKSISENIQPDRNRCRFKAKR
ncbi:hypothetical protein BGX26_003220 [Mortierella sp. AD094]|nr:hypothetical protein BGX26_003220 [Mortierella sp. AD094]